MEINFFNTYIHENATKNVESVLNSTFLSEGTLVKKFESRLENEFQIVRPVALNSGTSALHLALELIGITEGDEVIMPAQTFVATGLVVLQQRAVPVFADIEYGTGNIDVNSIEQKITSKTKAIMPVHWGGYPCDMDSINTIAKKHGLRVIEDAAHALGAKYKGKTIGSISDFTCFSFQAIKHLTTGDGGAISCLDNNMQLHAFTKRWFGINRANATPSLLGERQYNIESLGFKYHMNDYAAALGLANMDGFFERLTRRINIANRYRENLLNLAGITLFDYEQDRESAYWLFGFHVSKRDDFIKALKSKGITASVVHQRIDRNNVFGGMQRHLTNQEKFDKTQIHIPIHDDLDDEKVDYIINTIKSGW